MDSFRKLIRGWLGKVLLVLFLAPVALVGIEGYFGGSSKGDVAKKVNGQDITNKDLDELMKAYRQQYLQYVQGDESLLNTHAIQEAALNTLIAKTLLLQQAKKLDISMSDAQFVQMLSQLPDFQVNGKFSNELFGNYLKNRGITKDMLIANLRQDHALKMLSGTISNYAIVSNADINYFANLQAEQRELYLASIKLDDYKKAISVNDAEIEKYYEQHLNNFRRSASVDVDYVVLKPSMFTANQQQVTDAELQQAYTQYVDAQKANVTKHVRHILVTEDNRSDADALKLINEVEGKIKAGLSFADAAKQYSEDPTSKAQGGLLADYQPGTLGSTEFDDAVKVAKNGQVSQPIKTHFGYHIIEVQSDAPTIASFDSMKEKLRTDVLKTKANNVYTDTVNNLNDTIISADALDVVTQQVKEAHIETARHVSLWTKDPYLSNTAVKAKIFNDDVKNGDRNVSTSIALNNGETIWVKVRNYYPEGVQALAQVKDEVKAKLINQKASDEAKAKISAALQQFASEPAKQVLAKNSTLKFEKAGIFTRQNLKKEIADVAFTLPVPKADMWSVGTTVLPNELLVVAVSHVDQDAAKKLTPEQLQQVKQVYQQARGEQEMAAYVDYLKSNAKIK
ncbi:hypothetical protein P256_00384 [Acinetobacter nectaris CIP 110549]|uniref:Periplasmic chaperone PpiD n=1 Tax=Acinetobacter nectaris CIP 110549 TaxID=1392540 RepID=V2TSS3_9GAMM|nr:SurA N-terminal domain-containing protein [Acinetobacter nectaris]ESK40956.1 hypothetical protein P256_00384 [Acinetobacter nectaris CIP 110549]